jgi:hypothetical protein
MNLSAGLDRGFGSLETDLAVGAVTEGLVDRSTAAAERECGLAGEIVFVAVGVDQFDKTVGVFYAKRAIRTNRDFDLRHGASRWNENFKVITGIGDQLSGFRFQVSGFRFQVSGFRFQVSGKTQSS